MITYRNKSMSKDYKKRTISNLILTLRCLESANLALQSAPMYVPESDTLEDQICTYVLKAEHLIYDEKYPCTDNQKLYINTLRKIYTK